jgi:hypothetical protein
MAVLSSLARQAMCFTRPFYRSRVLRWISGSSRGVGSSLLRKKHIRLVLAELMLAQQPVGRARHMSSVVRQAEFHRAACPES